MEKRLETLVSADIPGQACHQTCCMGAMKVGHGLSIAYPLQVEQEPIIPALHFCSREQKCTPLHACDHAQDHISFPFPEMHHLTVCLPCDFSSAQFSSSAMLRGLVVKCICMFCERDPRCQHEAQAYQPCDEAETLECDCTDFSFVLLPIILD